MIVRVLIIALLVSTMACSQSKILFDVSKPYKGFIVKNDVNIFVDQKKDWFKPSLEEVKKAEELLSKQIEEINKDVLNQGGKECPVIHKNLSKYIRQYIGYINAGGDKVIFMNMIWNGSTDYEGFDTEYNLIFDGCSHYWRIKVNLNTQKVYDLEINGSA